MSDKVFEEWLSKYRIVHNASIEPDGLVRQRMKNAWQASGEHHTKKAREDTVNEVIDCIYDASPDIESKAWCKYFQAVIKKAFPEIKDDNK